MAPAHRPRWSVALAGLAAMLALGGCAGAPSEQGARSEFRDAIQLREDSRKVKDIRQRQAMLDRVKSTFSSKIASDDYSYGLMYVDDAAVLADRAMGQLRMGHVAAARFGFKWAADNLAEGVRLHERKLKARARDQQEIADLLVSVATLGAAYATVQAGSRVPATSQQALVDSFAAYERSMGTLRRSLSFDIASAARVNRDPRVTKLVPDAIRAPFLADQDPLALRLVRLQTGRSRCTGSLLSGNIVLTAAHCVEEGTPTTVISPVFRGYRYVDPASARANYLSGKGALSERSGIVVRHPDWRAGGGLSPIGKDLALVYLRDRRWNWLRASTRDNDTGFVDGVIGALNEPLTVVDPGRQRMLVLGFPGDLGASRVPRIEYGCSAIGRWERGRIIRTNCTAFGGTSGGPVYLDRGVGKPSQFVQVGVASVKFANKDDAGELGIASLRELPAVARRLQATLRRVGIKDYAVDELAGEWIPRELAAQPDW